MTKKEFEKRMSALKQKQNAIKQEMVQSQNEYISSYPIKIGDKCTDEQGNICWVCGMSFWDTSSTWLRIFVNPAKNDGTRSKRREFVYGRITKIRENK